MGTDMSAEAERWREAKRARAGTVGKRWDMEVARALALGDALAAALEAMTTERNAACDHADDMAAALEAERERVSELRDDRDRARAEWERLIALRRSDHERLAELEAGLDHLAEEQDLPPAARRIARDLLAGRAAGGEGS